MCIKCAITDHVTDAEEMLLVVDRIASTLLKQQNPQADENTINRYKQEMGEKAMEELAQEVDEYIVATLDGSPLLSMFDAPSERPTTAHINVWLRVNAAKRINELVPEAGDDER